MSRPPLSHWENLPEVLAQELVNQLEVGLLVNAVEGIRFLPERAILMEFEPQMVVQMGVLLKGDNRFKKYLQLNFDK
jgi:hypothetical protein